MAYCSVCRRHFVLAAFCPICGDTANDDYREDDDGTDRGETRESQFDIGTISQYHREEDTRKRRYKRAVRKGRRH